MANKPVQKDIQLIHIDRSATNPRKHFDDDDLKELADSIEVSGVIQPVLLRPLVQDGRYELVCGERRYRASLLVKDRDSTKDTIPAYIRDLTDEEVLELQITENLQRKDVHPISEANGIKSLMQKGKTAEDIAKRLGKRVSYVKKRLLLTDLTGAWQQLFFYNKITLGVAMKIAKIKAISQDELYMSYGIDQQKPKEVEELDIRDHEIEQYMGSLSYANFDLNDKELIEDMEACIGCKYNSATAALFPEDTETPVCNNIKCFFKKQEQDFDNKLKEALEDPTAILISSYYGDSDENQNYEQPVYNHMQYNGIYKPDKPAIYEEWLKEEYYYKNLNDLTDEEVKELKEEYEQEIKNYEEELKAYEQEINSPELIRAFFIDGSDKGTFIKVELNKNGSRNTSKKPAKLDPLDSEIYDIDAELTRLEDRANRNIELDREKVHKLVKQDLKDNESYKSNEDGLKKSEVIALIVMISSHTGPDGYDVFQKHLNKSGHYYPYLGNRELFEDLNALDITKLWHILNNLSRHTFLNMLMSDKDDPGKDSRAACIRAIAEDYMPKEVKTYDLDQQGVADRRTERANKKFEALEKRKAELQKQKVEAASKAKPKKKAPAKKSATKKTVAKKK